ncbi:LAME_0G18910g1_1 [Lachancea meyersii CBS 8951]|uniref:LAME_0G18910g1_1 n=1 Tax=Lachancea meyersii CBS 8951 TaxID=1266667 RepID=A0A1G4KC81_9SACH|nr:LAME_0G18910g1_1 [Lachancea meyersii CBS 8951]
MNNCKRPDLIVNYKHVPAPKSAAAAASQGILAQSMPMAAMFMKNKFLAWFALLSTVHYALNGQGEESAAEQSPLLKIMMSGVSLAVCYMNVVFPQPGPADKKA